LKEGTDTTNAYLLIHRENPFTKEFVLRGLAPTSKYGDISLTITVCG
jgi:hypothetical protein